MTTGQLVMAVSSVASIAIYVGCAICLARKAKNIPLERDEEQHVVCRCCLLPMNEPGLGIALLGDGFCARCATQILRK
ncbi:hypothetical protein AB8806_23185 [Ralstonia syzygii subsp. celebesensis]